MRRSLAALGGVLPLFLGGCSDGAEGDAWVAQLQALPASELDEGLGDEPLDAWMRVAMGPRAAVVWGPADCAIGAAATPEERCAAIVGTRADGTVVGAVIAQPRGVSSSPRLIDLYIEQDGERSSFATLMGWASAVSTLDLPFPGQGRDG